MLQRLGEIPSTPSLRRAPQNFDAGRPSPACRRIGATSSSGRASSATCLRRLTVSVVLSKSSRNWGGLLGLGSTGASPVASSLAVASLVVAATGVPSLSAVHCSVAAAPPSALVRYKLPNDGLCSSKLQVGFFVSTRRCSSPGRSLPSCAAGLAFDSSSYATISTNHYLSSSRNAHSNKALFCSASDSSSSSSLTSCSKS